MKGTETATAAMVLSGGEVDEAELENCKWIAQDADGRWYGYTSKPAFSNATWVSSPADFVHLCTGVKAQGYKTNLYKLIDEEGR